MSPIKDTSKQSPLSHPATSIFYSIHLTSPHVLPHPPSDTLDRLSLFAFASGFSLSLVKHPM